MNRESAYTGHLISFVSGGVLDPTGESKCPNNHDDHTNTQSNPQESLPSLPETNAAILGQSASEAYRKVVNQNYRHSVLSRARKRFHPTHTNAHNIVRPSLLRSVASKRSNKSKDHAQVISLCDSASDGSWDSDIEIVEQQAAITPVASEHQSLSKKPIESKKMAASELSTNNSSRREAHPSKDVVISLSDSDVEIEDGVGIKVETQFTSGKASGIPADVFVLCDLCDISFPVSEQFEHLKSIAHQIHLAKPPSPPPLNPGICIDPNSRGFKMMKAMNWGGEGLGLNEQGRLNPVDAIYKVDRKGLGVSGPKKTVEELRDVLHLRTKRKVFMSNVPKKHKSQQKISKKAQEKELLRQMTKR